MKNMLLKVKKILDLYPQARNSDQELYKEYMFYYHPESVITEADKTFIEICDGIPQQQDISRYRRKIQELGFCKATENIRRKRKNRKQDFIEMSKIEKIKV